MNSSAQAQRVEGLDIDSVQGILAVRSIDGWLLAQSHDRNAIARALIGPKSATRRAWYYFIPATGQPRILVHRGDVAAFARVPGTKVEYRSYRDLKSGLRTILSGAKTVAMEYDPDSGIASLSQVDAATVELVKKSGATVVSSAALVQLTKSLWRPAGRAAHYLAVHHLTKLRDEALGFVADRLASNKTVSEADVRALLQEGYRLRGLSGTISVAVGERTAEPGYQSREDDSAQIKSGQLIVLRLSAAVTASPRPIFASLSWVAYTGEVVPERYRRVFRVVVKARDAAIDFLRHRTQKRRLVRGYQVDQIARKAIGESGLASRFLHRTGHSLDTSLQGDGANLDDYETHDRRTLVVGSGFTVGPGVYRTGDFGVQTIADVLMIAGGIEVTTPLQTRITPLSSRAR